MIKNSTKTDAEVIARATKYQTKWVRIVFLLAGIICTLIGIAVLCVDFIDAKAEVEVSEVVCLVVGIIFIVGAISLMSTKTQVKNAEKLYRGNVKEYDFTFTADGFALSFTENSMQGTVSGQYSAFLKVQEFQDMYLLFLNGRQLYIVLKSGMTEGTTEELSALFRDKVFDRFKVRYKK